RQRDYPGTGSRDLVVHRPSDLRSSAGRHGQPAAVDHVIECRGCAIAPGSNSILITGGFTQTNDCLRPIPVGGTCMFSVAYAPLSFGAATGRLILSEMPGKM